MVKSTEAEDAIVRTCTSSSSLKAEEESSTMPTFHDHGSLDETASIGEAAMPHLSRGLLQHSDGPRNGCSSEASL
jgi:hypothetical protein